MSVLKSELEFWGQSFIASPNGTLVAEANATDETVLIADCDFQQSHYMRTHWPFFRDRRIDAFVTSPNDGSTNVYWAA